MHTIHAIRKTRTDFFFFFINSFLIFKTYRIYLNRNLHNTETYVEHIIISVNIYNMRYVSQTETVGRLKTRYLIGVVQ